VWFFLLSSRFSHDVCLCRGHVSALVCWFVWSAGLHKNFWWLLALGQSTFFILGWFRMHFRDKHLISMHYGVCILLRMPVQDIPVWYYHLYGKSHYGKNPVKPGEVCSIRVLSSSDIFLISASLKFHVTDFVVGSSVIIYDYSCGYFRCGCFFCFVKSLLTNGICMALLYVAAVILLFCCTRYQFCCPVPFAVICAFFCEISAAGSFVLCLTGVWLSVWFCFVPDILMFLHCMLGWDFYRPRPFLEISTRCQKKINYEQEHKRLLQLFPFMWSEEMKC